MTKNRLSTYELINTISHAIGFFLGIGLLVAILIKNPQFNAVENFIYILYMGSFILLFYSSSMYHAMSDDRIKRVLRVLDHTSIFFFIAGTYGPYVLKSLEGASRVIFLSVIWIIAILGFIYKLMKKGDYDSKKRISLILYISMGWMSLLLIKRLYANISTPSFVLLILGGITYTAGAFFYKEKSREINHVIWHFFVLAGAILHFMGVYYLN